MQPILVVTRVSKQFPGVRALDNVDFDLMAGEVHALVGENGAGKSTLVKILGGLLRPTSGTLQLNGHVVHFDNPFQSQAAGISVITQEFSLVPQLTIAENIYLGREPVVTGGLVDWKQIRTRSAQLLHDLGLKVPPTQRVEYLSVADKQLVEIAKALSREFRVIIMDEPTAALNAAEVDRLFAIIDGLRQRGVGILYVSHRLGEIFRIADRVTVLRDGKKVGTRLVKETSEREVITMMVGRALEQLVIEREQAGAAQVPALSVRDLSVPGALSGVSFDLNYGEVLGCAGLIGSGRSELVRALFGLQPPSGGQVFIDGRPVLLRDPGQALQQGIFMLPEDRKVEGIFPDLTVLENLLIKAQSAARPAARRTKRSSSLSNLFSSLFLDQEVERTQYNEVRDSLAIRAYAPTQMISTLSGGNQQKVMLGRALVSQSRILLLNEPTRGVDVGTKVEIHELIRRLAKEGHAVLVSSSDVPELVNVSDRCMVLSAGRVTGLLSGEQVTEDNILACAVGHAVMGEA